MKVRTRVTIFFAAVAGLGGWSIPALFDQQAEPVVSQQPPAKKMSAITKSAQSHSADRIDAVNSTTILPNQLAVFASWQSIDDVGEIERLLNSSAQIKSSSARYIARRLLLQRWGEIDGAGAMAYASAIEDEDEREVALWIVVGEMVANDFDLALETALALRNRDRRRETTGMIVQTLSKSEPARAFELAMEHGFNSDQAGLFNQIMRNWATEDLPAAAEAVVSLKPFYARERARAGVRTGLVKIYGLEGALDRFASETEVSVYDLLEELAKKDPKAFAARPEFAEAGFNLKMAYVGSLAKSDPAAALAWIETNGTTDARWFETVAREVAGDQPELALQLVERAHAIRPSMIGSKVVEQIANNWAEDPQRGIERIAALESAGSRRQIGDALAKKLAEDQPERFFELWDQLREPPPAPAADADPREIARCETGFRKHKTDWKELFKEAVKGIDASADPQRAARLIASQPDEFRTSGLGTAFRNWAYVDAPAAAAFFDENYASISDEQIRGVDPTRAIAGPWSADDPVAAAEWVSARSASNSTSRAMSEVMSRWVERDPDAALKWLAQQPESPMRDSGLRAITNSIYQFDPQAAIALIAELSSGQRRAKELAPILERWIRSDPQSAAAALEQGVEGLKAGEHSQWQQRAQSHIESLKALQ